MFIESLFSTFLIISSFPCFQGIELILVFSYHLFIKVRICKKWNFFCITTYLVLLSNITQFVHIATKICILVFEIFTDFFGVCHQVFFRECGNNNVIFNFPCRKCVNNIRLYVYKLYDIDHVWVIRECATISHMKLVSANLALNLATIYKKIDSRVVVLVFP